jgi:rod shape-determining protein MreD
MIAPPKIWLYRLIYALLGGLMIAYPILPLHFSPTRWPAPALLYGLTLAWVVRQPDSAPFLLVAALALLADAVLMRPMGLWALLLLVATETVRASHQTIRERGLMMEFTVVAALLTAMIILQNLVLWISFSTPLELARMLQLGLLTLLCYPFIVVFLHYIARVRKPESTNRPDRLGKIR